MVSQGDIIIVDFDPTRGHEPRKRRPALVVSSFEYDISTSMTLVCAITSTVSGFYLHDPLPEDCPVQGSIVLEQVRALDLNARPHRVVGHLDEEHLRRALVCLRSFFERSDG